MTGKLRILKRTYISPLAASDSGIKRHGDAIFRARELALGKTQHDLCEYFLGFAFSLVLP